MPKILQQWRLTWSFNKGTMEWGEKSGWWAPKAWDENIWECWNILVDTWDWLSQHAHWFSPRNEREGSFNRNSIHWVLPCFLISLQSNMTISDLFSPGTCSPEHLSWFTTTERTLSSLMASDKYLLHNFEGKIKNWISITAKREDSCGYLVSVSNHPMIRPPRTTLIILTHWPCFPLRLFSQTTTFFPAFPTQQKIW